MSGPGASVLWRLWFVQASWNRQALQGLGFTVAALPWVRRKLPDDGAMAVWLEEHLVCTNTNPYLAGLLLGTTLRLEEEGHGDSARSLGKSLSRNLGALGDGLFWRGLRPATALAALAAGLLWGPWPVLAGWLAFLIFQGWVRARALSTGYAAGATVVELVSRPLFHRACRWACRAALLFSALALGLGASSLPLAIPEEKALAVALVSALVLLSGLAGRGGGLGADAQLPLSAAVIWLAVHFLGPFVVGG